MKVNETTLVGMYFKPLLKNYTKTDFASDFHNYFLIAAENAQMLDIANMIRAVEDLSIFCIKYSI